MLGRRETLQTIAVGGVGTVLGILLGKTMIPYSEANDDGLTSQDKKDIMELRKEAKVRRDFDGHIAVQARDGRWFDTRLDAQIPGTVLMRDPENYVYFLTLGLQQIDLTDDYVVVSMFGDGGWERLIKRVQAKDEDGSIVDVRLDKETFRDLVSIQG